MIPYTVFQNYKQKMSLLLIMAISMFKNVSKLLALHALLYLIYYIYILHIYSFITTHVKCPEANQVKNFWTVPSCQLKVEF